MPIARRVQLGATSPLARDGDADERHAATQERRWRQPGALNEQASAPPDAPPWAHPIRDPRLES